VTYVDAADERKRGRKHILYQSNFVVRNLTDRSWTEFLESLCTPDYRQDQLRIKDASATTCEWICDHHEYLSYRASTDSCILYVLGKAGSGKSVLAKHVWKRLSKELADSPKKYSCVVLYYCCDQRARSDETASSILRALIHQFLLQKPSLFSRAVASDELMQSHSFLEGSTTWTFDSLWSLFEAIVINSQLQVIYCVIDALDESERESMETFLPLLTELLDRGANGVAVKLFLTSRTEGHIKDYLEGHAASIQIDSFTRQDVETYISTRLAKLKNRLRLNAEGKQNLQQVLLDRAEGMFLWAELAIKDLEKTYGLTAKSLPDRVRSLPFGLDALYERMLINIINECRENEETIRLVRKIFTWVVLATRPLTLAELRIALAIELDTECLDSVEPLQSISHDLLYLCGSFVEIVQRDNEAAAIGSASPTLEGSTENDEDEDLTATVRLIHQSAKDYLITFSGGLGGPLSRFRIDSQAGNGEIGQICLTYLLSKDFGRGPIKEDTADDFTPNVDPIDTSTTLAGSIKQKLAKYEFLDYAALHWPTHVRESYNIDDGKDVHMHACKFLSDFPEQLQSWLQVSHFLRTSKVDHDSRSAGIHVAGFFGLYNVARLLLDQGAEIEAKRTGNWTALHLAAQNGHLEVVKLLLDQRANINAKCTKNSTALHLAAQNGHLEVVKLLLNQRADIDAKSTINFTALHLAGLNGHLEMVKLLLNQRADINAKSTDNWTALQLAAQDGHLEVVKLLLNQGAEIEAKSTKNTTALHLAAQNGHLEVVKLLLNQRADIDAKSIDNWTVLHLAARNGHLEVVKLLLDRGAEIEAKGTKSSTALHSAARNGRLEVVKLLLDREAEIEAKNTDGWTALHSASFNGHLEVVKLLLDQRADINAKSTDSRTALYLAAQDGHLEVVKLLLNQGAEIEAKSTINSTALHSAARNGRLEVVKLLLDREAEIEAKNTNDWTALHSAAFNGHLEVVKLLLDQRADIDAKSTNSQTALYLAARNGHLEIVQLLLNRGAEIDTKINDRTALHLVAQNGRVEIVRLLLDQGAKIEAKKADDWTALHLAASDGHLEVVKLLLDQGAEIEAKETDNWTALHLATSDGHLEVVKLLLDQGAEIEAKETDN
jgi:ankyrin repeat protein